MATGVQRTLTEHWRALVPVALLLGFASSLLGDLLDRSSGAVEELEAGANLDAGSIIVGVFSSSLLIILVTLVLDAVLFNMIVGGERTGTADLGEGFRVTMGRIGSLVLLVLMLGVLVGVGLVLFILPGVFAIVVLFPAVAVLYLEGKGAVASMKRSYQLVIKRFLEVFGLLLILVALGITAGFAMGALGFVGSVVASALGSLVGQAATYHAYMDLSAEPASLWFARPGARPRSGRLVHLTPPTSRVSGRLLESLVWSSQIAVDMCRRSAVASPLRRG
ncbi:MAG: hypothetical protein HKN07_05870 [Acidimicrobiia bacterium]|nr:hypothetical protein [Acidimicrobiia bacterium]